MKVYWRYMCDYGHAWTIFRDKDAQESESDARCSYGHYAVTLSKDIPVDEVQITIQPAGFIADPVKQNIFMEGMYWLVITDMDDTESLKSTRAYTLEGVLKLVRKFAGLTKEAAWALWEELSP